MRESKEIKNPANWLEIFLYQIHRARTILGLMYERGVKTPKMDRNETRERYEQKSGLRDSKEVMRLFSLEETR